MAALMLLAVPLSVGTVARSASWRGAAPAGLVRARRILRTMSGGGARIRLSECAWSADRSRISCRAVGAWAGACTFDSNGAGGCHGSGRDGTWVVIIGGDRRG